MHRDELLQQVVDAGIVAIVRSSHGEHLVELARALLAGGVRIIELTFTVPDALEVLRQVRAALGESIVLGAGTVLDAPTARAAILAGAEFIVAPTLNLEVIALCRRYGKLAMPGAFSPTEILAAYEAGADLVKVFPAEMLGPAYLKALRAPLPQVRLMPTGGVDLHNLADYFRAGAACVGVGSQLVEPQASQRRDWARISELAGQYVAAVRSARAS
jgi:2-dehydro-3-deoxyphosphogluconate aldolase/(4S)-4-hydroxy-2-oxoglutarate aldolase